MAIAGTNTIAAGTNTISVSLSASQNNYAPTNWGAWINRLQITPTAAINLTGLLSTGFADGSMVLLENRDSTLTYNLTLVYASSSSSGANQFLLPGGVNYALIPYQKVLLTYDATSHTWGII